MGLGLGKEGRLSEHVLYVYTYVYTLIVVLYWVVEQRIIWLFARVFFVCCVFL
jgi:hypothetical protein